MVHLSEELRVAGVVVLPMSIGIVTNIIMGVDSMLECDRMTKVFHWSVCSDVVLVQYYILFGTKTFYIAFKLVNVQHMIINHQLNFNTFRLVVSHLTFLYLIEHTIPMKIKDTARSANESIERITLPPLYSTSFPPPDFV